MPRCRPRSRSGRGRGGTARAAGRGKGWLALPGLWRAAARLVEQGDDYELGAAALRVDLPPSGSEDDADGRSTTPR
ncbi:exported hypothetical protein [Parafrankia sp. Ea1.12]|nr:exported hypothetical protein [Parafrankia sp. Ea1.12]